MKILCLQNCKWKLCQKKKIPAFFTEKVHKPFFPYYCLEKFLMEKLKTILSMKQYAQIRRILLQEVERDTTYFKNRYS